MKKPTLLLGNCMDIMNDLEDHSIHAVCTDPPYGLTEFSQGEVEKLQSAVEAFGDCPRIGMGVSAVHFRDSPFFPMNNEKTLRCSLGSGLLFLCRNSDLAVMF